jgi:hypothetical protein
MKWIGTGNAVDLKSEKKLRRRPRGDVSSRRLPWLLFSLMAVQIECSHHRQPKRINDVILVYIYLHPRFIGTVLSWILTATTQAVSEYFPRFRIQRTKAAILANAMTIPVNLNIFEFVSNS